MMSFDFMIPLSIINQLIKKGKKERKLHKYLYKLYKLMYNISGDKK